MNSDTLYMVFMKRAISGMQICNENQLNQLRTRFPVVRSARNLHPTKFAQLTSQNPQIKEIAQSRLWGRSLENH